MVRLFYGQNALFGNICRFVDGKIALKTQNQGIIIKYEDQVTIWNVAQTHKDVCVVLVVATLVAATSCYACFIL